MKEAAEGTRFRLAFDQPGTWSQKYNLMWDRILGLNLFPPEVARKEIAYYKTKLNPFGLPLDNRQTYTKTDWEVWTATRAGAPADWEASYYVGSTLTTQCGSETLTTPYIFEDWSTAGPGGRFLRTVYMILMPGSASWPRRSVGL